MRFVKHSCIISIISKSVKKLHFSDNQNPDNSNLYKKLDHRLDNLIERKLPFFKIQSEFSQVILEVKKSSRCMTVISRETTRISDYSEAV